MSERPVPSVPLPNPPSRRISDRPPIDRGRIVVIALVSVGIALVGLFVVSRYIWPAGGAQSTGDGAPSWSPDSRRLAFSVEHDNQADVGTMNADGTGRADLMQEPAYEGSPAYSPDGSQIAYDTDRDGNFEIYVVPSGGGVQRRLTNNPAKDQAPVWSPDGRRIAFLSDRAGRRQFDVYVMGADGTNVTALTDAGSNWSPRFSPVGNRMALQVEKDVHILDLETGVTSRLTFDPQDGMSPTWAPDGARIAFTTSRRGKLELFMMKADGSDQHVIATMAGGSAIDPAWSPDGSRIAFVYVPDSDPKAGRASNYAIYVVELASEKVTRVSP